MGYTQISLEERCTIAQLCAQGVSVRQIAAALGRAPSTIARELRRNRSRTGGYRPVYAHDLVWGRRWSGARLDRDTALREEVLLGLERGWSPEQVAGRFVRADGRRMISYESIYRFIYAQVARKKDYRWRNLLSRAKAKRGRRPRRGHPARFIAHRRPLADRPVAALDRQAFGHWEADLMLFGRSGPAVLALHERHSRLLITVRQRGKAADPVADAIARILGPCPSSGARR